MSERKKIRIIAPVNTDCFNERILAAVQPVIPSDFDVDIRNIREGNDCIQNRYNLTQNALDVVRLARETEIEGYQGIFVTDFDMCGVEAAREVVDIPVIGGFRASAFTAMMLSQRFSIITILGSTMAMQLEHVRSLGLNENFASIRAINCPVEDLGDEERVADLVFREAMEALEKDGAQSFILGCTGFIGIAGRVRRKLMAACGEDIPVMDPNMTALSWLVLLVRNGLSQSRRCYSKVKI